MLAEEKGHAGVSIGKRTAAVTFTVTFTVTFAVTFTVTCRAAAGDSGAGAPVPRLVVADRDRHQAPLLAGRRRRGSARGAPERQPPWLVMAGPRQAPLRPKRFWGRSVAGTGCNGDAQANGCDSIAPATHKPARLQAPWGESAPGPRLISD